MGRHIQTYMIIIYEESIIDLCSTTIESMQYICRVSRVHLSGWKRLWVLPGTDRDIV